jgi:hypothetical protein
MKTKFFLALLMVLCISSFLRAQTTDTIINENNGFNGNYVSSIGASGSSFYAQSFIAGVNEITKFGVVLKEIDPEGELILSIAADSSGSPKMSAMLYQGTLINPSTVGDWFYESGIHIPVTLGQKYYVIIDGYNNAGATGRSGVGVSDNYTITGEGMKYSNSGGIGAWSSIPSMPLAIYVEGSSAFGYNNGYNGNSVTSVGANGSDFYAQSFIADVNEITGIGAVLREIETEGEVLLALAADSAGSPKMSALLYQGTLKNPSTVASWFYEFGFNIPVTIGQRYYVLIDGYNNAGATGRSGVGLSNNYTGTGEGMKYSNSGGIGAWSSIPTMPLAIFVEGIKFHTLSFEVSDTNGVHIAGATVALNGYGERITNASGIATFDTVPETLMPGIAYQISAPDYFPATGNLILTSDSLHQIELVHYPYYAITFHVKDGTNNQDVSGANVDLTGYSAVNTDINGNAVFGSVTYTAGDSIAYQVTGSGFSPFSGFLVVASDTVEEVVLTRLTCSIIFHVSDGTNDVEGAQVAFTGYGIKNTNTSGLADFENVSLSFGDSIAYVVTGTGMANVTGKVIVDMTKIVEVVGIFAGIPEISEAFVKIYPNPAQDIVNIVSPEKIGTLDIVTMQGALVKKIIVEGENAQMKVSELPAGNYMLIIRTGANTYLKPLSIVR